jgi:hypothetical protein
MIANEQHNFIGISSDSVFDNLRTGNNIHDRILQSTLSSNGRSKETNGDVRVESNSVVIYRYKFTDDFMSELYKFSKIHQYDERKDFKEAWKVWVEDNDLIIEEESLRLQTLGYEGDIIDKMFKSARYYFRKKSVEKKEPKQRRQYISVNRELLEAMDNHIEKNYTSENYQPKTGFLEFCQENVDLLKEAINSMFEKDINNAQLIEGKIKKTYKNRYFIFVTNK